MSNNDHIGVIAERYSEALIGLGESLDQLDTFDSNLSLIKAVFDTNDDFRTFLEHPTIPVEDKKEVLDSIFKDTVSPYVLNFLKLLLDKNRMFAFPVIVRIYHETLNKKRNISTAEVITSIKIDNEVLERIKATLEKKFEQKIQIETRIDPDIIAGMIVKIGDKVIDGSIKTKLENMKKQLI